jgi:hypothetical protein
VVVDLPLVPVIAAILRFAMPLSSAKNSPTSLSTGTPSPQARCTTRCGAG